MILELVLVGVLGRVMGQSDDGSFDYGGSAYRKPPPAILMHKQALTQDGSFNFVFAAENGLKQGETIAPDGTRTGAYSYVDPSGQTVSVKYSAGKDGFKIIEGSHVPKPPPHVVQQQLQQQRYAPPPAIIREGPPNLSHLNRHPDSGSRGSGYSDDRFSEPGRFSDGSGRYSEGPSGPGPDRSPSFRSSRPHVAPVQEYVPGPEDRHVGPHSFGSGYAFEFQG
ncbi:Insect cuticle protein [Nesidiocoris tenuis]|nr:Insect cuticle protein [Nesidiocoris tenuis]